MVKLELVVYVYEMRDEEREQSNAIASGRALERRACDEPNAQEANEERNEIHLL